MRAYKLPDDPGLCHSAGEWLSLPPTSLQAFFLSPTRKTFKQAVYITLEAYFFYYLSLRCHVIGAMNGISHTLSNLIVRTNSLREILHMIL